MISLEFFIPEFFRWNLVHRAGPWGFLLFLSSGVVLMPKETRAVPLSLSGLGREALNPHGMQTVLPTPAMHRMKLQGVHSSFTLVPPRAKGLHWDFWELCSAREGMEQRQQPSWRGWDGAGDLPGCQGRSSVLLPPSCIQQQKVQQGNCQLSP